MSATLYFIPGKRIISTKVLLFGKLLVNFNNPKKNTKGDVVYCKSLFKRLIIVQFRTKDEKKMNSVCVCEREENVILY